MTGPYTRAYIEGHRRAHLIPEGAREALCGAKPRKGRPWLSSDSHATDLAFLPDCRSCTIQARTAAAIAAWDGPPQRPGIIARIDCGTHTAPIGECARCELVRHLPCRGLCAACWTASRNDGTLSGYGWTRAERLDEYARLRASGLDMAECARRIGVCDRTISRYERALAGAGHAPWRRAS